MMEVERDDMFRDAPEGEYLILPEREQTARIVPSGPKWNVGLPKGWHMALPTDDGRVVVFRYIDPQKRRA